jgi:SAM-dependent methyltransferase
MINKDDFDGNIKFGGKKFHQSTARDTLIKSVEDGDWGGGFFYTDNGVIKPKKEYFEDVNSCILCGSKNLLPLVERKGLAVVRCNECDFGMQNPRFKADRVHEIYEDTYCMDNTYSSINAVELDKIKFMYGIQEARKINNYITSVLDVGCGPGLSLYAYKQAGIQNVKGLDPGKYSKDLSGGITIVKDGFEEISSNFKNVSLVTMWDVLEHIHDIKYTLADIWNVLEDDGLLLIMVPNLLSLATRLIRSSSPTFSVDHLNYFTENSLELALKQANFKVVSKETVISEIDNCRNYLEFSSPYDSVPKNEDAFSWLTANYIHDNMMGSRLLFIAKKIKKQES